MRGPLQEGPHLDKGQSPVKRGRLWAAKDRGTKQPKDARDRHGQGWPPGRLWSSACGSKAWAQGQDTEAAQEAGGLGSVKLLRPVRAPGSSLALLSEPSAAAESSRGDGRGQVGTAPHLSLTVPVHWCCWEPCRDAGDVWFCNFPSSHWEGKPAAAQGLAPCAQCSTELGRGWQLSPVAPLLSSNERHVQGPPRNRVTASACVTTACQSRCWPRSVCPPSVSPSVSSPFPDSTCTWPLPRTTEAPQSPTMPPPPIRGRGVRV